MRAQRRLLAAADAMSVTGTAAGTAAFFGAKYFTDQRLIVSISRA